jgi:hypothetical protein
VVHNILEERIRFDWPREMSGALLAQVVMTSVLKNVDSTEATFGRLHNIAQIVHNVTGLGIF